MPEEKKEMKQKPKPNFIDKYKGSKDNSVKFTLVDGNGKETVIKR